MESNIKIYQFSEAGLISECSRVIICVDRDISDFASHKITPSFLADFSVITLHLSDLPTDEELEDSINAANENKDGIRELIHRRIVAMQTLAEHLWGTTGKYKAFGFENTNTLADGDVLLLVKRVVRVSRRYLTELKANGFTDDILIELTELGQQYLDAIRLIKVAINERESQAEERAGLVNHMHDILKMLSNIGKSLYQTRDANKYNDYILRIEKTIPASLSQSA